MFTFNSLLYTGPNEPPSSFPENAHNLVLENGFQDWSNPPYCHLQAANDGPWRRRFKIGLYLFSRIVRKQDQILLPICIYPHLHLKNPYQFFLPSLQVGQRIIYSRVYHTPLWHFPEGILCYCQFTTLI